MCGIAGFIERRSSPQAIIQRMTQALRHRGPDGEGFWTGTNGEWTIALGHRRLSIIDIEGGRQPMGNEDGKVQITYNGEVYNFRQLRIDLERAGHRFGSRSDTEVIVHHYEEHGTAGLTLLDGMFAFAMWDDVHRTLLLARDRAGIKPLYYAFLEDGGIVFASELRAILEHPGIRRKLDPNGLISYFFSDYAHPPDTLVRGVNKLPPGHFLLWKPEMNDRPSPQRYWQLEDISREEKSTASTQALGDRLFSVLDQAVNDQLVADVPVGIFLSGGLDSSLVAALARRHLTQRPRTFSIGFDDPQFDESPYARLVAEKIGSTHVEHRFNEQTLLATLDDALNCLDEPMADPSILPTYLLSRVAAEHVKVVLSGDGGDELWAGYPTYRAHRYAATYRAVPRALRSHMIEPLVAAMPLSDGYQQLEWKAKRFALRWADEPRLRHLRWMSSVDLPELTDAIYSADGSLPQSWQPLLNHDDHDLINSMLALDFQTYMSGSVLTKVDRASMAHGLEVRPPLLGNRPIDFAFSLPSEFKLRGKTSKFLLKQVAGRLLPEQIIHRKKRGFAIPLARWLRGPLKPRLDEVLANSPLWRTGLLCQETFQRWAAEHLHRTSDRARPLWALLVLHHWYRRTLSSAS